MTGQPAERQYNAERSLQRWVNETSEGLAEIPRFQRLGTVQEVAGLTVVSNGPPAQVGELCRIEPRGNRPAVEAQVVGFRDNRVLLMPLGELQGVEAHCPVIAAGEQLSVPVGPSMQGRIVDAFGAPVDGAGSITAHARRPVHGNAPRLVQRRRITTSMSVGVRAIDLLLTCGKGQRLGVFGGSGVGKSVLMGMIARNSSADVNVIALVGERGREVLDFVEEKLGPALDRSIVVVATSDQPPLVRLQAGFAATTIAEHFRDRGADVLLMMDSITRLARAQREIGLTVGEMPTNRGYPPSVYEMIPRLVERVGPAVGGTITGIYTVLVEGDDMLEPVADTVRATLDGHIILSRELAQRGHYPAIDVTASVSRLMDRVIDESHREDASVCRRLLQAHRDIEDLLAVGAYEPGADSWVDAAIQLNDDLNALLRQDLDEEPDFSEARVQLRRIVRRAREMADA